MITMRTFRDETLQGFRIVIARCYDNFGRKKGYSILGDESRTKTRSHEGFVVEYEYDEVGRFKRVSHGEKTFTYNYLNGTDLVAGYSTSNFVRTVNYENNRDLIASVSSRFNDNLISSFTYTNDAIGRRTSVQKDGAAFSALQGAKDNYGYNYRSEVISARRTKGDEEIRGFAFDYAYDPIGNRKTSATYDETDAKHETTYTANSLNQYTQRTVPGNAQVYGEVITNATVTVNTNPTYRHGAYFYGGDDADNSANATFKELAVEATTDSARHAQTGSVFVAKSPEEFTYDADGNLTSDGRFRYTWNGENRLIRAEELYAPDTRDAYVITYAYDHQGRMVRKDITTTTSAQIKSISYLWDGYNIIRETTLEAEQSASISTKINIWGIDLNGTLQGAGGVGGLLAVTDNDTTYIPTYDANGNVSEYINDADGAIAAHYDYSQFGEQILASGDLANFFTHRFSTKPFCLYVRLMEYQYRKYNPELGRWLSRDPIEEKGGVNLYVFCGNAPQLNNDSLGLKLLIIKHWNGINPPGGWGDKGRNKAQTHYNAPDISAREVAKEGGKIGFEVTISPCVTIVNVYFRETADLSVVTFHENEHLQWIIKYDEAIETFKREAEAIVDCPEQARLRLSVANKRMIRKTEYYSAENDKLDAPGGPHGH